MEDNGKHEVRFHDVNLRFTLEANPVDPDTLVSPEHWRWNNILSHQLDNYDSGRVEITGYSRHESTFFVNDDGDVIENIEATFVPFGKDDEDILDKAFNNVLSMAEDWMDISKAGSDQDRGHIKLVKDFWDDVKSVRG